MCPLTTTSQININGIIIVTRNVPDKTDKLITLSTCDSSGKNRIIIHGVYVKGQVYRNK